MKGILLLLALIALNTTNVNAQCTPDPLLTDPGVYPDSATGFSNACVDVAYEQLITVIVPLDTTVLVGPFPVDLVYDSVVIVGFTGLPNGFTYSCYDGQNVTSPADQCAFEGNTKGCVLITGNPTNAEIGSYPLIITVDAYLGGSTSPASTEVIDYYSIDVSSCVAEINDLTKGKYILYPVPAGEYVSIRQNHDENILEISMYDAAGELIRNTKGESLSGIDISGVEDGIYFLQISTANESNIIEIVVE